MKASFSVESKKTPKKQILYNVSFMLFIDAIGVGIVFPILPQLILNEHVGLIQGYSPYRAYFYSLILAIYPIMNFFGMSFFGIMSDKYGRAPLLFIGLSTLVISYFLTTFAIINHNFALFLFCRAASGFLGGIYSVGNAIASDVSGSDEKERLDNFRLPSLADKLGTTIGPALSIFVTANSYVQNEYIIPYVVVSLLGCLNILLLIYNFKHFKTHRIINLSQKQKLQFSWLSLFNVTFMMLRRKKERLLIFSFFAYQCGAGLFIQGLSFYLTIEYNYTPSQIGLFSSVMGIFIVCSNYGLTRVFEKYFSCVRQLKVMLPFVAGLFFYSVFAKNYPHDIVQNLLVRVWIMSSVFYLSLPLVRLAFTTLFSSSVNDDEQGLIMGVAGQITALSYFFSASFVGHAVLSHLIIIISGLAFLLSYCFLSRYLMVSQNLEH